LSRTWALWLALGLPACGGPAGSSATLSVFAASSLTDAFTHLAEVYEAAHPGIDVRLSFAGSQTLRLQIEGGAPADVFAAADAEHMDALESQGLVEAPRVFAYNELAVIVPLDNPAGIEEFAGLAAAERLVIGAPDVPVGRYTREMLSRTSFAGAVLEHVVSEEANVRQVRAKVELGEADAAIVYRTDALASDRVRTVAIPGGVNVRAEYLVAVTTEAENHETAEAWVGLIVSEEGTRVLREHGFSVE